MRIITFHPIIAVAFLCITAQTTHAADWKTHIFTNETVVANSSVVISALLSGEAKDEARVQALVGSQVAFYGVDAPTTNRPASLLISSNIVLDVELQPARFVRVMGGSWSAEVLGTLKSVDFKKRIIHIRAKPEDWRLMVVF